MIGAHHHRAGGVNGVNALAYNLVAGEDLHVDGVGVPGLGHGGVEGDVVLRGDILLAPLLPGAEGKQDGGVPQDSPQLLQGAQHLPGLKNVLVKIHAPLHNVQSVVLELPGLFQDPGPGGGHNGDDDLGHSGAHLYAPQLYGFHHSYLL